MALTYKLYTGDGANRIFNIPFVYLSPSHIKVYLNGVSTEAFAIANGTVTMDVAPAAGVSIRIQRETPSDKRMVDYKDGSVLDEEDLDTQSDQVMYLSQETYDKAHDALGPDPALKEQHNARNKLIKNVAYPVEPNDAANKQYVDDQFTDYSVQFNQTLADTQAVHDQTVVDANAIKDAAVTETTAIKSATQDIHDQAVVDTTAIKVATQGIHDQTVIDATAIKDDAVAQTGAIKDATQGIHDQAVIDTTAIKNAAQAEADRAAGEADFATAEANRATTEANRSKSEADRSYNEAERSRIEADRAAAYKGPHIRPEEFGADPSGIADSSVALMEAIRAAHDQGLPLYCTGVYRCANRVQAGNLTKSITIFGDGRGITKFVGTSQYGVFNLIFTNRDATVDIQNLSISTTRAGGGTALRVEFTNTTSWAKRAAVIQNVDIVPSDYTAKSVDVNYFNNGIVLMDCWNSYISNVNILGNTNEPNMNAGVYFQGASIASTIDKCDIYFADKGILCEGSIEGFRVHDGSFVACNWGVYHDTTGGEPEFKATNSHFNCWKGNVFIRNAMRGVVTGNFFKALDPAAFGLPAVTEFADIVIEGNGENAIQDIHVHNNQFNTPVGYTSKACVVGANANGIHFRNNTVRDRTYGVHVLSTSLGKTFVEDNYMPTVSTPIQFDNRVGCYYRWDQPDYCRVYRTTYAGITSGVDYAVPWNAREGNNLNLWSGTANTKLFVPAHAALVRVTAFIQFNLTDLANGLGWRWVWINKNGQFVRGLPKECFKHEGIGTNGRENNSVHLVTDLIAVQPGDYFELMVWHEVASGIYLRTMPDSWMDIEVVR